MKTTASPISLSGLMAVPRCFSSNFRSVGGLVLCLMKFNLLSRNQSGVIEMTHDDKIVINVSLADTLSKSNGKAETIIPNGTFVPDALVGESSIKGSVDDPKIGLVHDKSSLSDANLVSDASADSKRADRRSCDLYHGKWVYDPAGPLYTSNTCPIITQTQNCQVNGRPDKEYVNYRWNPDGCDLPRFDAKKFLELMRHKTLAFVGDSVEAPKNRGNRRMQRWYFPSTSTSIARVWSSWLVNRTNAPLVSARNGIDQVQLDIPDKVFMDLLPRFDVLVLSSGHWFAKRSAYLLNGTIVGGQLWWPKEFGTMPVNNVEAFGISVETSLSAIANNPNFTGLVIIRSYSPDHYEGGAWNTGGSCTGKTRPVTELVQNGFTDIMYEKQVTGFQRAAAKVRGGAKLRFMDITEPFAYRPDGHPGPYRNTDPKKVTTRGPTESPRRRIACIGACRGRSTPGTSFAGDHPKRI
uniref:Uncharacterized protein n=1 Tax=Ananas comosus var. bracteatus TaxID=296719 RepID=A0A6V7Q6V3_ANACO|nr:unnamed protein product [Ananas comosus var. bracteatus]